MRPTASGAVLQSVRPNILIILTDDQSTDELSAMPRTTAWFQEGSTVFDRGYVTTPLRCPSRSTIFSGRYIHNHGNTQNDHPFNLDQSATFQRYLQDAGYTTALDGKFLTKWPNDERSPLRPLDDHVGRLLRPLRPLERRGATRTRLPTRRPN